MDLVVTVEEVKSWTRVDDAAEEGLLTQLILTAQEIASRHTNMQLTPGNCPAPVKQAIMVMVAAMYGNREGQSLAQPTVDALLARYRRSGI